MNPDKCQYCGAPKYNGNSFRFTCGTYVNQVGRGAVCYATEIIAERAARQKAEKELEKWKDEFIQCSNSVVNAMVAFPNVSEYVTQLENQRDDARRELESAEAELDKALSALEEAERELRSINPEP